MYKCLTSCFLLHISVLSSDLYQLFKKILLGYFTTFLILPLLSVQRDTNTDLKISLYVHVHIKTIL